MLRQWHFLMNAIIMQKNLAGPVGKLLQNTGAPLSPTRQMNAGSGEKPNLGQAALDRLIQHPDFDHVVMAVARNAVEEYRQSWALNRILSDRGRVLTTVAALDLYFADPDRAGFSVAHLSKDAAHHGFASLGRISAWAATLRLLGYLAVGVSGRPQRLVPTQSFFTMFRSRMQRTWQPLAMIHPPAHRAIKFLKEEEFLGHVAAGFMGPYRNGQRVIDGIPELAEIVEREGALCVLLSIMLTDAAGRRLSIAGLAREFAVSRAHVRSILEEAETMGLVKRAQEKAEYYAQPQLTDWMRRFFAALFQTHIFMIDYALSRHVVETTDAAEDARRARGLR